MAVAARPDEIAGLQIALLRHHVGEERIRCNIERNTQKNISATLIHLAGQPPPRYMKLEERMTGRERHFWQVGDIPGRHNETP